MKISRAFTWIRIFSLYFWMLQTVDGVVSPKRKDIRRLIENRHGMRWNDGMVPYSMDSSLITKAVMGAATTDDEIVVYVKRHEK